MRPLTAQLRLELTLIFRNGESLLLTLGIPVAVLAFFSVVAVLLIEVAITAWDFVVEDRTRRLSAFERLLHTVLTLLFGVVLMALAPLLFHWFGQPTAVTFADHGEVEQRGQIGASSCR